MAKNFMTAMMNTKASTPQPIYSQTERVKKEITVLDSIKKFIPPLSIEEKQQLEQNILEFGCKDPLTIWETNRGVIDPNADQPEETAYVLIDGHNRYEICQRFSIDFKINVVEFESFDQIHGFMIDHQLGRRNLSPEQMSYLRGLKYNSLKKNDVYRDKSGKFLAENLPSGQNDQTVNAMENENNKNRNATIENVGHLPSGQNDQTVNAMENENNKNRNATIENVGHLPSGQNDQTVKKGSLAEQLAEQFNVGEKTIRRDADFAKGLDLLPIELRNEVLQGKSNFSKADIIEIGKNKGISKVGEVLKNNLDKKDSILKNKETSVNKKKEKIIHLAKSMSNTDDCDKLIALISDFKSLL